MALSERQDELGVSFAPFAQTMIEMRQHNAVAKTSKAIEEA
jgi:hypothetical protein